MRRCVALILILLTVPTAALAQTVVDRCQSDTEPGGTRNLAQALTQGGRIVFACPPGTAIRMTMGHTVAPGTTIDGEGNITLDAHGAPMLMFYVPNGSFAAERLTIRNVALRTTTNPAFPSFASVLLASGDVSFTGVSIIASDKPVHIRGNARVINSEFSGNGSWALTIAGNGYIESSRFIGNGTGLSLKSGVVRDSLFAQNTTGALRITYPKDKVTVLKSNFLANNGQGAVQLSQRSGGDAVATVAFKRNRFAENSNSNGGGAITIYDSTVGAPNVVLPVLLRFAPARFEFGYNHFTDNHGSNGGAINADLHETDGLVITGGLFLRNTSDNVGGAISWVGRSILITHSLFRANRAQKGGALYADYRAGDARWTIANSLVSENSVAAPGGAIEVGPIELYNVTVARNSGIGIVADVHGSPPELPVVVNTIIAENSEGNCRGIAPSGFRGANLQFGHRDCGDVTLQDPMLDALYVPALGSPALLLGDVVTCRTAPVARKDIIFQSRATDDRCALGAFERPPIRRIPPLRER